MASTKCVKHEIIICDDCGRSSLKDQATRYDYTCPAARTAYVCSRCQSGETPITHIRGGGYSSIHPASGRRD